jgi:rhamnogalacturonyl hydrolase YesR
VNCTSVRLLGFSIRNAPSWTIHPQGCRDLVAAGLHISAPADSPNTDGFNPEMCEDVTLEGIRFSVGDDCIAIKAGKRADDGADDHLKPTRRIAIRHCLMERGHGGVVIGSEMSGGVEDVQVSGCELIGTDRGLRLKTRRGRGGAIRNVLFENVRMDHVATAISANAHYCCDSDGRSDYVQSRAARPLDKGTPSIEGIVVRNVEILGLANAACVLLGLPEAPIRDVLIDDLRVESFDAEAIAAEPVMACGIRPMRHEGIVAEYADVVVGALKGVARSGLAVSLTVSLTASLTASLAYGACADPASGRMGEIDAALAYFDEFCHGYRHYKGGAWCYEDGCIYRGLVLLHRTTGESRWLDHLLRLTEPQIAADGTLARYVPSDFNIDNILAGRSLFHLAEITGDARYMKAAATQAGQLERHPRIATGNYWHKRTYPDQVWLDGLYMGLPFQIEYGQKTTRPELVDDAVAQFLSALELTAFDRLFAHGYDHARRQPWADPETGRSPAVWARAVGWLAMALVDAFELTRDRRLVTPTAALLRDIAAEQRSNGLWPQVLDAPDLAGNYEESSASAMFAYALLVAARLDLGDHANAGRRAYAALVRDRLTPGDDGHVHFTTICHVAGLGSYDGGPYRSGTREYYLQEKIVSDDAKGVGPFMMATAEIVAR